MVPTSGPSDCDVDVYVATSTGYVTATKESAYSYSTSLTPFIDSISPTFGTAAGGTTITLGGSNLPEDIDDVIVTIDGVECAVQATSVTEITCVAGPKPEVLDGFGMYVASKTNGAARIETDEFVYMDKWSDRITWAGV